MHLINGPLSSRTTATKQRLLNRPEKDVANSRDSSTTTEYSADVSDEARTVKSNLDAKSDSLQDSSSYSSQLIQQDYVALAQRHLSSLSNQHSTTSADGKGVIQPAELKIEDDATTAAFTSKEPVTTQGAPATPDSNTLHSWVRIPFPLSSFVSAPINATNSQSLTPGAQSDPAYLVSTTARSLYEKQITPGWFNLGATPLRELTVSALNDAGNSVWEKSRRKRPHPLLNRNPKSIFG